ncbi:TIGR04222 domain-containing membrane protein [Micromonospora sp. DT44]|uniref:TIGR04222 domain-containing membrane protein n=1 Tax=Micromonospora sp. DT44 TaxID=3393439 RepID=UPI003CE8C25B
MIVHAASGDTWGVPGPTFLRLYLVAAVVLVTIAVLHRVRLGTGAEPVVAKSLGPPEVAYLNGGPALAVHAALGGLRRRGAIDVGPDRRLLTTGPTPSRLTQLEQAIHGAAHQGVRARDLGQDQRVAAVLDQLGASLEGRGLRVSQAQQASARQWRILLAALLVFGVVRLFAGLANGRPVGFLLLTLVGVAVAVLLLWRVPQATRAGRNALRDLRTRHHHLAPDSSPAYATYGAAGAAMGVALYGTASLWAIDPGFAAQAEIQRQAIASSGWSSGAGTGSSGTTGSSCGGGSS